VITGGSSVSARPPRQPVDKAGGTPVIIDRVPPSSGFDHVLATCPTVERPEAAVAEVAARHSRIDAVVTAAGTDACGRLEDVDAAAWERVIAVNLIGTAAVIRAAIPHLSRTEGRIVTVASTLGLRALSDATAYCASKFAIVGFSRALAIELAGRVDVTMLVPGGMSTAFFDDRDPQYKPGPDARLNDPANVAAAVLFALQQPPGCVVRELIVTPSTEPSWP
jgi:NAD(P)-dependent dehydrogenase (short-subunit alcohol dehydrogenase family)